MCGIVGYIGPKSAVPVIIGGLEKLEYRGYDSAGVATVQGNKYEVFRSEGKLGNLKELLTRHDKLNTKTVSPGVISIGMGHTRWATHGRPSETNAHPHIAGNICVVHNGIIENYVDLRERLQAQGCVFASETDTEIAAHLINSHLKAAGSLFEAVRASIKELHGSYALVVMSLTQPDRLVVAKNSTPVIIGIGDDEVFVASDVPALLEHTRKVVILEDGELAEVAINSLRIEHDGREIKRQPITVTWDPITAEKGGYRHFMLKEIHEQPQVVMETFRGRINQQDSTVFLDDVAFTDKDFSDVKRICMVACGTAWHAALVCKFIIEQIARIPVEVDYASEYRYRDPIISPDTLVVAISQSGETADTLGALTVAADQKAKTLAICNVVGSSIARRAKNVLYTHAGPEISVASTKAFATQLTAGYLLALKIAQARKTLNTKQMDERIQELLCLPALLTKALESNAPIEAVAKKYFQAQSFLFLGRGILYPIALEGALKLKELSYIHAEGYPAGEMKHGPIALISEETPVVAVVGRDGVNYDKTLSNLMEVRARGGQVIAITDETSRELKNTATEIIEVGAAPASLLPMTLTVPLQLLAYHIAVLRGTDVDQPRNLAKSVTVE